jgi:putative ABC transport system permease protein
MRNLLRRLAQIIGRTRADVDLADEIESHRAMLQDRLEARGLPAEEAARASRRALGNVALAREDARHVWVWRGLSDAWQDLRFGVRALRRNPGFTAVALLTLALGIGITTTMFTIIEAVLLRPLPYESPDRLALLWTDDVKRGLPETETSYLTYADWRTQSRHFSDMAIFQGEPVIVKGPNGTERVLAEIVSANIFTLLGVAPAAGRVFTPDEEERAQRVVVISHSMWRRQFGGSTDAIGATITVTGGRVSDEQCRVVGVMPREFYFPSKDVQLWRPTLSSFVSGRGARWRHEPRYRFIVTDWSVIGRLQPDATVHQARSEMTAIGRSLSAIHAAEAAKVAGFAGFAVNVVPLRDQLTGNNLQRALWVLLGAVTVVLLIACVNVANLLLARGAARAREFAIRSALGAGRFRLMRQSLTESMALGVAAALLGLLLANAGVRALATYAPPGVYPSASTSYELTDSVRVPIGSAQPGIPRLDETAIDWRIVSFAAGLSLFAVLLFGLAPSGRLSKTSPREAFPEGGRSIAGSRSLGRMRQWLVAVECALAVVLLVAAGLLIRSLARLDAVDPGFSPGGVLLLRVSLAPAGRDPAAPVDNVERRRLFYEQVRERLAGLPRVQSVGLITDFSTREIATDVITVPGPGGSTSADFAHAAVDGGFFTTVGVPVLKGRSFTGFDTLKSITLTRTSAQEIARTRAATPAIVNELFAERHFRGVNPVGRRFGVGAPPRIWWYEVVGVVGNMRREGLDRPPIAEMYSPYIGQTSEIAVRTAGDPLVSAVAVRDAIRSVDPNGIVMSTTTLERRLAELDATRQLQARLLTSFASLSLLLAAIGIYGVVRYSVAQRTQEIGVRIALGARPRDVLTLIVGRGLVAPAAGLGIGLLAALALTRVLAHALFETSPTDPITLGAVTLTLLVSAFLACVLPALRAARVDPVVALRHE